MMLFSEIYSTYYRTVEAILQEALEGELSQRRIIEIVDEMAYLESNLTLVPALKEEWLLLDDQLRTPLRKKPQMPLTYLQKRWLKALLGDPRLALFDVAVTGLETIEPLFSLDVFDYFDRYSDGDPFTDATYIRHFKTLLTALKEGRKVCIHQDNRQGRRVVRTVIPYKIEYSSKDDKFRLMTRGGGYQRMVNIGRIIHCELGEKFDAQQLTIPEAQTASFVFELVDERKALDRVMLHFLDCKKETRRLDDNRYQVTIWYMPQDVMEMVIRILAFGPMIRVVSPQSFVDKIKRRLHRQKELRI